LKNTITIQEKTLETTTNGTSEQQLHIAQNNIRQKELALEQTKKELDNLQIVAPFDGTLRKIDFKVGDKITSTDEKYVYLENPNLVEVSILLDQIDVVHVRPGMKVSVELDAYPGETFE
jgi:multidrug resistance efflux pump